MAVCLHCGVSPPLDFCDSCWAELEDEAVRIIRGYLTFFYLVHSPSDFDNPRDQLVVSYLNRKAVQFIKHFGGEELLFPDDGSEKEQKEFVDRLVEILNNVLYQAERSEEAYIEAEIVKRGGMRGVDEDENGQSDDRESDAGKEGRRD